MTPGALLIMALLVILGGGVGAALRFLLDHALQNAFGREPLESLTIINIAASTCAGMALGASGHFAPVSGMWMLAFASTGVCGGMSSFSAAVVEAMSPLPVTIERDDADPSAAAERAAKAGDSGKDRRDGDGRGDGRGEGRGRVGRKGREVLVITDQVVVTERVFLIRMVYLTAMTAVSVFTCWLGYTLVA